MRLLILAISLVLLGSVAVAYTSHAIRRSNTSSPATKLDLARKGQLVFRNTQSGDGFGKVASVGLHDPGGKRSVSDRSCARIDVSAAHGVCLAVFLGALGGFDALILDRRLRTIRRIEPPGIPSRARLAPSGEIATWTAFVTGHSYATTGFSTRTSIADLRTRKLYRDLETLRIHRNGTRYRAPDINIWGVTFAADNRTFYATMASAGRTYLIKGDREVWQAKTLRENAECPSLSPDGRYIAFKKRIEGSAASPWRLAVVELATMKETELGGTDGIDDQAAWLDGRTLMYGMPRSGGGSDVWTVTISGADRPRLLIRDASSPSIVR